ncbi:hypothetical protein DSECCO2_183350 [anaerobic digester metagenome]
MRTEHTINNETGPQYASPVSRDLEGLSHELMGMSTEVTGPQWARLRLIVMQLRSIAGQVDGLVIPEGV